MRGRLKKERARTDLAVIGDEVEIEAGDRMIVEVLPRRTKLSRLHPGSRAPSERGWSDPGRLLEDVLVANLDRVLLVFSASTPRASPRLIDRFLVVAEHNGVEAVLVLSKLDEAESAGWRERFLDYERIGYRVLGTSARSGEGIAEVRELLAGRISALAGPSGAGKSSLLNAVEPGLALAVGAIDDRQRKGRHTTRLAELHPAPGGGWVADTPGIRELASFAIPARELGRCFPEMRAVLDRCTFSDCLHEREPGCAVREALATGVIAEARYESYLRQLRGEDSRA